jgi:hypothetical protein
MARWPVKLPAYASHQQQFSLAAGINCYARFNDCPPLFGTRTVATANRQCKRKRHYREHVRAPNGSSQVLRPHASTPLGPKREKP